MTWIRHTKPEAPAHRCTPPTAERFITLPAPPPPPAGWQGHSPPKPRRAKLDDVPAGAWRDLWRCDDCGELWRVGNGCSACDPSPPSGRCVRGGYHSPGYAWRPATWWQRFRTRRYTRRNP